MICFLTRFFFLACVHDKPLWALLRALDFLRSVMIA
jgi:hypothetical protein